MGSFFLLQHKATLKSPMATIGTTGTTSSQASSTAKGNVQALCGKHNLSCSDIQKNGDTITFTVNNSTVYISAAKDIDKQIGSLQLTIQTLTMEGKEFHRLDFRYDRPVISN